MPYDFVKVWTLKLYPYHKILWLKWIFFILSHWIDSLLSNMLLMLHALYCVLTRSEIFLFYGNVHFCWYTHLFSFILMLLIFCDADYNGKASWWPKERRSSCWCWYGWGLVFPQVVLHFRVFDGGWIYVVVHLGFLFWNFVGIWADWCFLDTWMYYENFI